MLRFFLLVLLACGLTPTNAQTRPAVPEPPADAQEAIRRGDFAAAIPLLLPLAADTTNIAAALQLAFAQQRTGAWAEAKRQYESLLQRRPTLTEALNQLALLSEREANYTKALGLYRRLLAQDSTNAYFMKQVGYQYIRLNQPKAATPFYQKAFRRNGKDLEAIAELARLYLDEGKKDQLAAGLLDLGLKLDPNSVRLLQLDSRLNYRIAAFDGVIRNIEKTMALGDTTAYYQRLLGTAYYQMDSLDKSVRTFERLLKIGEDTEPVHAGLATALLLGMKSLPPDSIGKAFRLNGPAQTHFRLAIERGTSAQIPDYLIGQADAMTKDGLPMDLIAKHYRQVYEKYQRPKALYRLGQLYETKDPDLAAIYYRELLDVCKNLKKAVQSGTDCLYAGQAQGRLLALKKGAGKLKPASPEPAAVAKDTASAAADTTGRD